MRAITHQLLDAVLLRVAVAAADLKGEVGRLEAEIGQERLGVLGVIREAKSSASSRRCGIGTLDAHDRAPVPTPRPRGPRAAFDEGADGQQHAPHVRMDENRSRPAGRAELRAGEGAALKPLAGELHGDLVGGLSQGEALEADVESGPVHEGEHGRACRDAARRRGKSHAVLEVQSRRCWTP